VFLSRVKGSVRASVAQGTGGPGLRNLTDDCYLSLVQWPWLHIVVKPNKVLGYSIHIEISFHRVLRVLTRTPVEIHCIRRLDDLILSPVLWISLTRFDAWPFLWLDLVMVRRNWPLVISCCSWIWMAYSDQVCLVGCAKLSLLFSHKCVWFGLVW
jgi:hypothetical protein